MVVVLWERALAGSGTWNLVKENIEFAENRCIFVYSDLM